MSADEAVETLEKVSKTFGAAAVGISALSGAIVGMGAAWLILKNKMEAKIQAEYEQRLQDEVSASVKFVLSQVAPDVVVSDDDPDKVAESLHEDASTPVEVVEIEDIPLDEVDGERVFGSNEGKPSLEDLQKRNQETRYDRISTPAEQPEEEEPQKSVVPMEDVIPWDPGDGVSVISRDIFYENVSEYTQSTYTYFSDGGVLDVDGNFIEGHESFFGSGRPPFGQMSDDANVVYVRNHKLKAEYEILSDPGSSTDFLKHSLAEMFSPTRRR